MKAQRGVVTNQWLTPRKIVGKGKVRRDIAVGLAVVTVTYSR
jgi:hypothetical protein